MVCFTPGFDVGYMMGMQKICFSESDSIPAELEKIVGYSLWCDGVDSRKRSAFTVAVSDEEEDEQPVEFQGKRAAKSKSKS